MSLKPGNLTTGKWTWGQTARQFSQNIVRSGCRDLRRMGESEPHYWIIVGVLKGTFIWYKDTGNTKDGGKFVCLDNINKVNHGCIQYVVFF